MKKAPGNTAFNGFPDAVFFHFTYSLETELILKVSLQLSNRYAYLLHGVAVADSNCLIVLRIKIICYTERSTYLILSYVALSNISSVIKLTVIVF